MGHTDATLSFEEFVILSSTELNKRTDTSHTPSPRLLSNLPPEASLIEPAALTQTAARLIACGFLHGNLHNASITSAGLAALEPYRVKRAVILAAGTGERMLPITSTTPKPLIHVKGTPLIARTLSLLADAGITDVVIVRGHLGSQFDQLRRDFPFVRFVENPHYAAGGNILSLATVKNLLGGSYIMDADLLVTNPKLITRYQYRTNYRGIPLQHACGWCFSSKDSVVTGAGLQVTEGIHQIVGISYWTPSDGQQLECDLDHVLAKPQGTQRYWDEIAVTCFPQHYVIHVHPCSANDVIEVDTIEELCALEPSYASYLEA